VSTKVPVVKFATPEAAGDLEGVPLRATVVMADVAAALREGLLLFATSAGLVVMQQMLTEGLTRIVGPKHAEAEDGAEAAEAIVESESEYNIGAVETVSPDGTFVDQTST
jgi:cyanophycinase-like exopeptidase